MYNSLYDIFRDNKKDVIKDYYEVKKGDSLYKIAQKYNISVGDLMKANNLTTTLIYPNQILILPLKKDSNSIYFEEYITLEKDTINDILKKYNIDYEELIKYNKLENLEFLEGEYLYINIKTPLEKFEEMKKNNVDFEKLVYDNKEKWLK